MKKFIKMNGDSISIIVVAYALILLLASLSTIMPKYYIWFSFPLFFALVPISLYLKDIIDKR